MIETRLESAVSDANEAPRGRTDTVRSLPRGPGRHDADDIRTLRYGVEALRRAVAPQGVSSGELARACSISRAAAYRVLQTLHRERYLQREGPLKRARYRATGRIRSLTGGYVGAVRLLDAAMPLMLAWTEELGWPLALAIPAGDRAVVRFTTDPVARRALVRYRVGRVAPALTTAATLVWLAHRSAGSVAPPVGQPGDEVLAELEGIGTHEDLRLRLAQVREDGYCVCTPTGLREATLAIPLWYDGAVVASLALRYMRIAEGGPEGHARRVATLRALGSRLVAAAAAPAFASDPGGNL